MNKTTIFFVFLFIIALSGSPEAGTGRHLVCYGGVKDSNAREIAGNADILIVGDVKETLLSRIRCMNPDIIILKYQHIIGFHPAFPDWGTVNGHEEWFAHDSRTGKRIIQEKYGWYLMNISNGAWRKFIVNRMLSNTPEAYDGMFIDDMWEGYVDKFVCEGSSVKGAPGDIPLPGWHDFMILCLKTLKGSYHGRIFLNGISPAYIGYADGVMHESFIHANWGPDSFVLDPSSYQRSLLAVSRIQGRGKKILIQSGTEGRDPRAADRLHDYCLSSFLLVSDDLSSFNFQPARGYSCKKILPELRGQKALGSPQGPYRIWKTGPSEPNLLENGAFEQGLSNWSIMSGAPVRDLNTGMTGGSARLTGTGLEKDRLASRLVPVAGDTPYRMGIWCKSSRNTPGSAGYMKLGVQGRFYDRNKKPVPGAFDLQFDAGSFGWQPYEATYQSPPGASFFRMFIGFIGDGTGEGWIDEAYFGVARPRECIARRDFQNGSVFVNFGDGEGYIEKDAAAGINRDKPMRLGAHEGVIILNTTPAR